MDEKNKILSQWRRAKKLNDMQKNPEVSTKLNRMLVTKDTKEKLDILDECIELLEGKIDNGKEKDNKIKEFQNILGSESFFKEDGKAQVIGLESKDNKLNLYERLGINENDDMKNYQIFKLLTKKTEDQETKKENKEGFHSIHNILEVAKCFEVPENINLMLCNTKNKISKVKLPYIYLFFDTKFIIEDRVYYGILLGDISQLREMGEKSKEVKNSDLILLGEGIIVQTFYEDSNGKVGWVKIKLYDDSRKRQIRKLKEYIMNLIYFINSEDVRIIFKERTKKNQERRIKNNKVPLPSHNKIEVVGYLKKYLYKIESEGLGNKFNYRFWVRGHFRHFWNKKYDTLYKKYKKGELKYIEGRQYIMDNSGALKLWIYPYVKGEGLLINQEYKLK